MYQGLVFCVQGENNISFVLYAMWQLDHSVPSLSALKRFVLPGQSNPQKVYILYFPPIKFDIQCE